MYINDEAFDQGLDYADVTGTKIDICSAEPTSNLYANIAAVTLGNKTGLNTSAPQDGDVDGRKVTVPAITDGTVTSTGDATYWVLSDGISVLLASGTLTNGPQSVTNGNTFTLDAIDVTFRDAILEP